MNQNQIFISFLKIFIVHQFLKGSSLKVKVRSLKICPNSKFFCQLSAFFNVGRHTGCDFLTGGCRIGGLREAAIEYTLETVPVGAVRAFFDDQGLQFGTVRVRGTSSSMIAPIVAAVFSPAQFHGKTDSEDDQDCLHF